ncbi:MAG: prolyl aminopeptidase [Bacteroidota bacterium]|nr:prolyl aminopeptidase [Bacteroidota bacterium]MDP4233888.1 prolyl aminopeptidase [Bacteroidota bacterium]MDP4243560.1 prolyl aminopeptidase [Bacteroidota bacterium]MDP4288900.1 prolyl aminopeptidase [Bacteroidota bacterium]
MRELYPALEPYNTGFLPVSELHTLYYEESGNPAGQPAVFVHGGPGAGTGPDHRRFFDPKHYRIILFDQRGCGRSTPHAELRENTTWDLVADMEKLRETLGLDRWLVFGGSWGSTLALAYAETHPERVTHLVLRGIFLLRPWEIDWLYQQGADALFPDFWEEYLKPIPREERNDLLAAYHKRLTSNDRAIRVEAAKAWSKWEGSTSKLLIDQHMIDQFEDEDFAIAFARIECHYFVNNGFMESGQLLRDAHRIRKIPTVIVHGRYDVVCPMRNAWDLHKVLPDAKLVISPTSGHSALEKENASALLDATDAFRI